MTILIGRLIDIFLGRLVLMYVPLVNDDDRLVDVYSDYCFT